MARVDDTGGNGFTVDNNVGSVFRTKINQCFAAINSLNSGSGNPSITTAYQPSINSDSDILSIRNGANNAFVQLGYIDTNFGINKPAFAVRPSAAQAIANTTFTIVSNNTEILDTDSAYNNSTYKFTVPTAKGGKYVIGGQVCIDDLQDGDAIQMSFYVNDAQLTAYGKVSRAYCSAADVFTSVHAQLILDLSAGDTVAQYVEHNEGNNQNTVTDETWFYGYRLTVS